jgi:hypothetical protein
MKVTYMLLNKSGKARKIPPGQAWQWKLHVEDPSQLTHVLDQLKHDIRDNRLTLANLRFERHPLDVEAPVEVGFAYKGPVLYDEGIQPQRIINLHADSKPCKRMVRSKPEALKLAAGNGGLLGGRGCQS